MPQDHPLRVEALRQFDNLMVDDGERFFFQPCFSPVWDTAIGAYALAQSDPKASGPAPRRGLAAGPRSPPQGRLVASSGPHTEPSGWAFEYSNEFYPDIDDTAMVMLALSEAAGSNPAAQKACHARAVDWLLAMQSSDGGWAAFDADNNWEFPEPGSLRRPQRHAGPHLRRYHRARAGSAGGARCASANIRRCGAAWIGWCATRSRTEAGTAAGAWLIFTAPVSRCAAWRHPAKATARRTFCAPASGCAPSRTPMAAGAKAAPVTTTASSPPARARLRKPPGRMLGLIAGGDAGQPERAARHRIPAGNAAGRRKLGRGTGHRDRVSPRYFI